MRTSYPKLMETMERISRQYLCDHFDEILERVDKEDIGFVITIAKRRLLSQQRLLPRTLKRLLRKQE